MALSGAERRAAAEALFLVAGYAVALKFLPFRVVAARVQSPSRRELLVSAQRMATLVDRAGQYLHVSCLPRALALARILAARGSRCELRIGVRRSHLGIAAHAWVSDETGVLIGGAETAASYCPLVTFTTASHDRA